MVIVSLWGGEKEGCSTSKHRPVAHHPSRDILPLALFVFSSSQAVAKNVCGAMEEWVSFHRFSVRFLVKQVIG